MKLQLIHTKNQDGTEYLLGNGEDKFYHLPLNTAPTLEGVPLLPALEDGLFVLGMKERSTLIMYTEEDMRDAYNLGLDTDSKLNPNKVYDDFIQSLSQPKLPTEFDTETKQYIYE